MKLELAGDKFANGFAVLEPVETVTDGIEVYDVKGTVITFLGQNSRISVIAENWSCCVNLGVN